jgi:hypothetical protein
MTAFSRETEQPVAQSGLQDSVGAVVRDREVQDGLAIPILQDSFTPAGPGSRV